MWQLYQKSHKFISAAVNFFTERGTPVSINIDNSPGAVNIVNFSLDGFFYINLFAKKENKPFDIRPKHHYSVLSIL